VPTYQYACTACGHQLEAVQSFTDEPLTECPACAGRLRKLFSSVGVVFKGSGFYRTDSRVGASSGATSDNGSSGDGGTKDAGAQDGGGSKDAGGTKDGGAKAKKPAATSAGSGASSGS
jgi:putative FmdB family regulatory protein